MKDEKTAKGERAREQKEALEKRKRYNAFIQDLQLTHVALVGLNAEYKSEVLDSVPSDLALSSDIDGDYEAEETRMVVTSHYTIRAKQGRRVIFKISCSFALLYTTSSRMDDELFDIFKSQTLVLNIWPYTRELVQNVTSRMGLPPLTLPLLKV